ncbi:MAG: hypothetical protein JNL50_13390, partial [Phycisphaerae bacterium]|nr:hypothetical protein [Phycisphaerae bacterium]
RDVFSIVRIRPAAIARFAGAAAGAIPMLRAMTQVESAGWEVFLAPDATARGQAWIEFAPAPRDNVQAAPPADAAPTPR